MRGFWKAYRAQMGLDERARWTSRLSSRSRTCTPATSRRSTTTGSKRGRISSPSNGRYRVTTAENLERGLPLGLIYATSRAMLRDRVRSLRDANVYEAQRYRHVIGPPLIDAGRGRCRAARRPTSWWCASCTPARPCCSPPAATTTASCSRRQRAAVCREDRDPRQPADRHAAGDPAVACRVPAAVARMKRRAAQCGAATPGATARISAPAGTPLPPPIRRPPARQRLTAIVVRAVLVRAHLDQRRLHDAGRGGRLADLRPHQRSARPRPGRARAVLPADRDVARRRTGAGPVRPPCRSRASARWGRRWQRSASPSARRRGGSGARRCSPYCSCRAPRVHSRFPTMHSLLARRRADVAVAACHCRFRLRPADRRHLRTVDRRPDVRTRPGGGLCDLHGSSSSPRAS